MSTMRESDTRPGDTLYTIYEHPQQAARKAWNKQDLLDQALDLLEENEWGGEGYCLGEDCGGFIDTRLHDMNCPWLALMHKAGRR